MTRITVWIDWISTLCAKMGKVIVLVGGTGREDPGDVT